MKNDTSNITLLNELLKEYESKRIPYSRLLETEEWQSKREIIIKRDNEQCTSCHNKTTIYVEGRNIWLYDYIAGVKQPTKKFIDEFEYYQNLLGDKFVGMSAKEDDYELLLEPETAVIQLDKPYHIQVHHKYYVDGKYPWEYDNDALITLCNWCHFSLHQNQTILVYKVVNNDLVDRKMTPCLRCRGAGFFPEYRHIQAGTCFRCNGSKYEEFIIENLH